jgi:hypothetical protein
MTVRAERLHTSVVCIKFREKVFRAGSHLGHVIAGLLPDAHRDAPQGAGLVRRAARRELGLNIRKRGRYTTPVLSTERSSSGAEP